MLCGISGYSGTTGATCGIYMYMSNKIIHYLCEDGIERSARRNYCQAL